MKVAMLLTRQLGGDLSGRKMVLRTAHRFFSEIADVTVFFIADDKIKNFQGDSSSSFALKRPGISQLIYNFFVYVIFGCWSINEVLFYTKENQTLIRDLLLDDFDFVYIDSLRMAPYVSDIKSLNSKCVIDFDDVYSLRYERLSKNYSPDVDALGFYKGVFPASLKRFVGFFMRHLLAFESKRISSREIYYAKLFDKRVIVSPVEALIMRDRAHVYFDSIAMTVPDYNSKWLSSVELRASSIGEVKLCLIGNFDYYPNQQSAKYIIDSILPVFVANNVDVSLYFVGRVSDCFSREHSATNIHFLGFVDDLSESVSHFDCLLSPILSGTGIKTKVIEAFSLGIPVVTNGKGIEGMDVTDGVQVLIAENPQAYYDTILHLSSSAKLQEDLSRAAYKYYLDNFSYDVIKEKWISLLRVNNT